MEKKNKKTKYVENTKTHLQFVYRIGGREENKVIVNGIDIGPLVSIDDLKVVFEDCVPVLWIKTILDSIEINIDGQLKISNIVVSDAIGREIYKKLYKRFGKRGIITP